MKLSEQIAKSVRDVHFGGNWTSVNLKDSLAGLNWQQANSKAAGNNTIVALVYHINYFVRAAIKVLEEGILDAHDKFSFDHPTIDSEKAWQDFLQSVWNDAEKLASLVERLEDAKLRETFVLEKYGNYYRNLSGTVEHAHYHLGQLVIIRKQLEKQEVDSAVSIQTK